MTPKDSRSLSIIIPALNEAASLQTLLPELKTQFPQAQIIVVDDGSTDHTAQVCASEGVTHLFSQHNKGNGASIKRGTRAANGDTLIFMDADGQHLPRHVQQLLQRFDDEDLDMLIGARPANAHASLLRRLGNQAFNRLASWMTNQPIADLTSGIRTVKAARFREFLHLLPNGFSYPTTSTMAFLRSGYLVDFEEIDVQQRIGKSHLNIWREGRRFLLIIFKIGALYSPMRLFAPISVMLFLLATGLYSYTYFTAAKFTNMSALLYSTALLTFLIGLVSEQITTLMFARREPDK